MNKQTTMFKVARSGGRWKYGFETLQDADNYEKKQRRRTGVFLAVVAYRPRRGKQNAE